MNNYVSIKAVLDPSYFPRVLRQEFDNDTILSYALDAYRLLKINQKLEETYEIITLKNHSAQLPNDVNTINLITYLINASGKEITKETLNLNECNFLPLRYVGLKSTTGGLGSNISCNVCNHSQLNKCSETYSLNVHGEISSSIKDGLLCVDYLKEIKDEEGNFLIIKSPEILNFLGTYAASKCWFEKAMSKEEQAFSIYERLKRESEILMMKAKGAYGLRNIDIQTINSIAGTETLNQRLMRSPSFIFQKH